jgi:glycosyltransferase involved in cell wall biosynthesis
MLIMKRILLLSYYYPPYTGIEGNRAYSWANFLSKNNFSVTVITRHWKAGAQQDWEDYFTEYHKPASTDKESNQLKIIRLPYIWSRSFKKIKTLPFSSLYYWAIKLRGYFHVETNAYDSFYNEALKELQKDSYDFIIVSSPPLNIVRLGYELKKATGVALVVDFRDSYNNYLLIPGYSIPWKSRIENHLFKRKLKQWLAGTDIVTSVSNSVLDTLPLGSTKNTVIVRNGFEEDVLNNRTGIKDDRFIISSVGSIYERQDIEFMAEGLALFLEKIKAKDVIIKFIGIKSKVEVCERIARHIDSGFLEFTPRISRQKAIKEMHNSTILLQLGWRGYKGVIPGKVFEYLAAKKNILNAPADGDLTDKLLMETGAGKSVETIEEMADYLVEKYREWKSNGFLFYEGKDEVIKKYSRNSQNSELANALNAFHA